MPFSAPFREPIIAPIFTPGGAVIPWYLLGGVTAAQCAAAYQPKGAADLAASYVNLNNPGTNNAAPGTAPTFAAATGWTFNGTSQWLDTGIIPTATTSAILCYSDNLGGNNSYCPALSSYSGNDTTRFSLMPNRSGNTHRYYEHGASLDLNTTAVPSGVMAIAGQQGYLNGVTDGGAIGAWSGTATVTIGIGKQNGYTSFASIKIQAIAIYNITLSSTQVGLISTAMAAL